MSYEQAWDKLFLFVFEQKDSTQDYGAFKVCLKILTEMTKLKNEIDNCGIIDFSQYDYD